MNAKPTSQKEQKSWNGSWHYLSRRRRLQELFHPSDCDHRYLPNARSFGTAQRFAPTSNCTYPRAQISRHTHGLLFWQLNSVWMLLFSLVFLGKNLLKPPGLSLCRFLIHTRRVLKNDEILAAAVTPKRAHFHESWCLHSRLTLLDRHCFHSLTLYLAACNLLFR